MFVDSESEYKIVGVDVYLVALQLSSGYFLFHPNLFFAI